MVKLSLFSDIWLQINFFNDVFQKKHFTISNDYPASDRTGLILNVPEIRY